MYYIGKAIQWVPNPAWKLQTWAWKHRRPMGPCLWAEQSVYVILGESKPGAVLQPTTNQAKLSLNHHVKNVGVRVLHHVNTALPYFLHASCRSL